MENDAYLGTPQQLRKLLVEMATTVTHLSKDKYLKGLVGSLFDTATIEEIHRELKAYNEGKGFISIVDTDNPRLN